MKPAPFGYLSPRSVDEAVELMASYGEEAKVIAGGQSLGPLLNLRLATPAMLIDVNRIPEISGIIDEDAGQLTLGAMTRQHDAETSASLAAACPLLTDALPYVAHRTIRNRGTVGGSLAHADPAAELPAVITALQAKLLVRSTTDSRTICAENFFQSYFTTALEPDELLVAVRIRKASGPTGASWQEFAPRRGDYAIVGVATVLTLDKDGRVAQASVVCSGVADVPMHLRAAEDALIGREPTLEALAQVAAEAADGTEPPSDLIASSTYRRHLIGVLVHRALNAAARAAGGQA